MSNAETFNDLEGVAVIGMVCRFPGAKNTDDFWRNLCGGVETISFFSDEELRATGTDEALIRSPDYIKARAILSDVELFDAQFFGYSPREVEVLDPQQRLFLECAWEALETSGYDPETYAGKIGVYAGTSVSSYLLHNLLGNPEALVSLGGYQIMLGNDKDHLATRVSYKLNLKGPSVNVQTACSTSLVAVHLACQSLLNYQSDMVLAGGVSVAIPQKRGYTYQEGGISSPDGHCRAFDAKAQGTVGGNGAAIVVLKRLEDAVADGDTIHAVIKGSAINNDGSSKVGYTAPSVEGQAVVIAEAQAAAGFEPESISYIEAHGTGTPIGDPIELKALTHVFRAQTQKKSFCAIGSVKTNIGHLDAAAGVAGLIKTVLALKHRMIPASLHFTEPNPQIDYANLPFYVNTSLAKWDTDAAPRRAGVSSFGIGGTNAHVVMEEAPEVKQTQPSSRAGQVLLVSAKTITTLEKATQNLADYLRLRKDVRLEDVAYTLGVGRRSFGHRRMVICRDVDEAIAALENLETAGHATVFVEEGNRPVAFMFSGQGTQQVGMGRGVYETEEVFRAVVDRCSGLLREELGLDLRDVLFASKERQEQAGEKLRQTWLAQPALFVFEYALAQQWMHWGVEPRAMIGHSIGEYVAACLAGVFTLEEALRLVAARGRLMQRLPEGVMLAVMAEEQQVAPLLERYAELSLAAVNTEGQCVISGTIESVRDFERELSRQGIICKRLETSHAFHSAMMDPILGEFRQEVERIQLQTPRIPWVSNVTGTWITVEEATDPRYWERQLRNTVRFADGLRTLLKDEEQVLLEIGPGRTLVALSRQSEEWGSKHAAISSIGSAQSLKSGQHSEELLLLSALGQLWLTGVKIDWNRFYLGEQRHRVALPTYPFERQKYWIESRKQADPADTRPTKLIKKSDIADWFYIPVWKQSMSPVPFEPGHVEQAKMRWIVFIDEEGVGSRLARRLEQGGQVVITVTPGETFAKLSEREYEINPIERDGYHKLLQGLVTADQAPQKIVHLWSLMRQRSTQTDSERFLKNQQMGYYSLLSLAQALAFQVGLDHIEVNVITNNMHKIADGDILYPEKATMLGPCKVMPQEYPNMRSRCIDIALAEPEGSEADELIEQLVSEITTDVDDPVVAYRGAVRWVESFEPVRLDEKKRGKKRLREKGVYLVTGGLGGVGLALAGYLAESVRAKLVLIGRSPFPGRDEWAQWLATHDEDGTSRKIKKLQELEELGAEVLIVSADVANEEQMREALAQADERFGEINGVIHAAGLAAQKWNPPIENTGRLESERLFRPKIDGVLVLEKVFEGRKLDFCLLVSSLSTVLGGFGMVAYAAANIFMDSFARNQDDNKDISWISVDWDGWRTREQAKQETGFQSSLAELEIEPKAGGEAFERILSKATASRIIVSTGDLSVRINQWIKLESLREPDESEEATPPSLHVRPNLQNDYVAPRNNVEEAIADIWKGLLGVEQVGIHDDFYDLGGHSLAGIHLIFSLRETFDVPDLQLNSLMERPTVAGLAESIEKSRRAEVSLPSILVPMQPDGTKPIFFCVHPVGGDVSSLIDLSRFMAPDQPFYGIQASGIGDVANYGDYNSMEEMAAEYISAIRFVSPEGPYFLGGFSYGGLVAFEMAQQLKSQGHEIALLAMLDTPAPDNAAKISQLDDATILFGLARERARQHGTELRLTIGELKRLKTEEEQMMVIADKLKRANLLPPGLEDKWVYNFIKGFRIRLNTSVGYVPQKYSGRITVFLATERDSELETSYDRVMFDIHDPTLGWDKISTEPIDVRPVPGFHEMIVREPYVRILAKQLRAALEEALESVTSVCS